LIHVSTISKLTSVWAAAWLATTACSQTFVVDAAGGPGSQFTQIAAALAAVPDGATLLVRPGAYQGFSISAQGVSILGESPVTITGVVSLTGTQPQQAVTLRGLSWTTFPGNQRPLVISSCQGFVLLEDVQLPASPCVPSPFFPSACGRIAGLSVNSCQQLIAHNCSFRAIALGSSNVVLEVTSVSGEAASVVSQTSGQVSGALAGISLSGGSLQIAGSSTITGGGGISGGLINSPAAPGISATTPIDLRLLNGSVIGGNGGGILGCCGAEAIRAFNGGNIRMDPRVTLTSQQTNPVLGVTPSVGPMPMVTATGAGAGGTLQATVATEIGDIVVLVLGFPGPQTILPPFADPFWISPSAFQFFAFGVQQAGIPVQGSITVPNAPPLQGLRVIWQAVATGQNTGQQASNPAVSLIH